MRLLKFGFWWLLLPFTLGVLLLALLLFSTPGARFVATVAEQLLPPLQIRALDGNLAHGLSAEQVIWSQPEVTVTLDGLTARWESRCLLQAKICVESLIAGRLHIDVPSQDDEPDDDSEVTPIDMPHLLLPLRLQVEQFHLAELLIMAGGRLTAIQPVSFSAQWQGKRVTLDHFRAATIDPDIGTLDVQVSGTIDMASEWPFNAVATARYTPPLEHWNSQQLVVSGEGNIRNLMLNAQLDAQVAIPQMEPLNLSAKLNSQALDSDIHIKKLKGQWNGASLLVRGDAHFSSEGQLDLKKMRVQWGKNRATLNGQLQQEWNIDAALTLAEPQLLAPGAQGEFQGKARITGPYDDPLVNLHLQSGQLTMPGLTLQGLGLQASVAPVSFSTLSAKAKATLLQWDDEQLQDVDVALDGDAARHHLSLQARRGPQQLQASATGALAVDSFDWRGQLETLRLQLDKQWIVQLERPVGLRWQQPLQRLDWQHHCLKDHDSRICSSGHADLKNRRGDIQLDIRHFGLEKIVPFIGDGTKLSGTLDGQLHLREDFLDPELRGQLSLQKLRWQSSDAAEALLEQGDIHIQFKGREAALVAGLSIPPGIRWLSKGPLEIAWHKSSYEARPHCWHARRLADDRHEGAALGDLCLQLQTDPANGLFAKADLELLLTSALTPFLPEDLQLNGQVTGHAEARLKGRDLQAQFRFDTRDGEILLLGDDDASSLRAPLETLHLEGRLQDEILHSSLNLQSSVLGNGNAESRIDIRRDNPQMSLTARLQDLNLALAQPLLPQLSELKGKLDVDVQLEGAVARPAINGLVNIRDVKIHSANLPSGIDDLDAKLLFNGQHGELDGLVRSGKGRANLTGQFTNGDTGWKAQVNLKGRNIPVVQPPDIRFMLHPDLSLTADASGINLTGLLLVNDGFLVLKPLPPDAIDISPDVEFVDEREVRLTRSGSAIPFGMNVVARVEPSLRIRGFGGEIRPKGFVRISRDRSGVLLGRGTIDIEEGSYTGYGQQLTIRKGQAIFNGLLTQPYVNLEAVRVVDSVVAGIRVQGPVSEPVATLFSEPAMSDSQILFYIIAGKAPGAATENDNTTVRNALLSLGLMGGQPMARDIASKVGVDDLQLGTAGSGNDTAVTLSGYLNSRTYLQYGISVFEPVNTLTVRYRLRDNLFLEAVNGVASALDLLYSFEF